MLRVSFLVLPPPPPPLLLVVVLLLLICVLVTSRLTTSDPEQSCQWVSGRMYLGWVALLKPSRRQCR
jgi:hypothetical protein